MRGIALLLTLAPLFGGCAKPKVNVDADIQVPDLPPEPEPFESDPATTAAMPEPGSSTSTYTPPGSSPAGGRDRVVVATSDGLASNAATTHKIMRGDTLYSLARQYYSDPKRWKTIYDANRDKIPSPKALPVGKTLVIP